MLHDAGVCHYFSEEGFVRRARLLLFVVAVALLWPSAAHASLLSWLEELSGPGPFRGTMVSLTVACVRGDELKACPAGDKNTQQTVVVRLGRLTTYDAPRFKDLPATDADNLGKVHVIPVSGLWLFRVHRSLEIGPGIGFMRVSGNGFDAFSKLSLTPLSASFTPFALNSRWSDSRWAYVLRLEFDSSFFPQGFNGRDFNNPRTTFDSGPEFLTRTGVVFDLGALGGAAWSSLRR